LKGTMNASNLKKLLRFGAVAGVLGLSGVADAATYTKADNTNALDQAISWGGVLVPATGDIARWAGAYSSSLTTNSLAAVLPGSALSWQGFEIGALSGTALTTNTIAVAITNITAATEAVVNGFNLVTITTKANHGFEPGQSVTIASVTPAGYNGAYLVAGVPSATQFTYTNATGSLAAGTAFGTVRSAIYVGGLGTPTAGSALMIGSSGIDMSSANVSVVVNPVTVSFNGNQQWNVPPGRVLRFSNGGVTAASARVLNSGNDGLIEISGGGIASLNEGGVAGLSNANSFATFTGSWQVDNGTTLRGLRSGATAWGTGTITLNGGTLAVGGISGDVGGWSWTNQIILSPGTTSYISEQNVTGSSRYLNLAGPISGSGNLIFTEPLAGATTFTSMDGAFVLCGDNSGLAGGTITIGGPVQNGVPGRLTYVRVGGATPTSSALAGAGVNGSLGAASVVNNGVLTFSRTDTYTVSNSISGTGSVRIGGALNGAETQNVIFAGPKTYSGTTTINRGTLTLDASATLANSSDIILLPPAGISATLDVSAGGFKLGSGKRLIGTATGFQLVNGNLIAASGSSIIPGGVNTTGKLTVNGDLVLSGGGTLYFDVGASSDLIQISGDLNPTGVTTIQATNAVALADGIYPLVNVSGALHGTAANFALTGLTASALGQSFTVVFTNDSVAVRVQTSPPTIVTSRNGNALAVSWSADYLSWVLQSQTNRLTVGLSNNWYDVPGSGQVTNLTLNIDSNNPAVFYRLRDPIRLAFQEDWSSGSIDPAKWYMLRKKWGTGNNGVTPTNVWIGTDVVNGTHQNVLICEAHGDQYTGPVTGYGGLTTRVGGVIVTKRFFASGRYEVVMKVGAPNGQVDQIGAVPAIWNYSYEWVQTTVANQNNFDPTVPMYNPLLKVSGSPATEYWSEIDYPELGNNGDFAHGGYNVYCQNTYDWKTYSVPPVMDGQYHTYAMEWHTGLKPLINVTDAQVIQHNGYWWVQDKTIPIASYLGNPLKRLGPNSYAAYTGLTTQNWFDGTLVGGNTNYVPCMASQLTFGVWLPGWGGAAPWTTAQVSFGPVKIWQYDDPGDVRGVLTEDVPPNF
jgi:autotransporter-associated beta strand protein